MTFDEFQDGADPEWKDYCDEYLPCGSCGKSPYRYYEFDTGEIVYQCSCGEEWLA